MVENYIPKGYFCIHYLVAFDLKISPILSLMCSPNVLESTEYINLSCLIVWSVYCKVVRALIMFR